MQAKTFFSYLFIALMISFGSSCQWSKTSKGGAIGAGAGGAIGGVVGNRAGNTAAGILIGATIGGATGAAIGRYMDKQAAEIEEDLEGAEVERVGEGILITFDSGLLFDVGKSALRPATKANLNELSGTLNKYPDTEIVIQGHTDSTGSDELNMNLSKDRARSVSSYLTQQGVRSSRFTVEGFGENQPVATNETSAGRQQNRRVEIAIFANEDLKEAAEDGTIGN